jgi:glycosyltransferase involved in cell wall biosynthesis
LFGQVEITLPAIENTLNSRSEFKVYFYSVTSDVEPLIKKLVLKFGSRVKYSTVKKPINREELLKLFGEALVYIGCSRSDAISTSFLEALVYGAYPIQTNTSCANEWVNKGAICSVVAIDSRKITVELNKIISSPKIINEAQIKNFKVALKFLSSEKIHKQAVTFYSLR